jgi:D-erythrulose 4-kinase
MTRIFDDPAQFTDNMLDGFVQLHAGYVTRVPGGVARATGRPGKAAVIVGGGSGHYPAFCGIVGPGFADAAVVGNVFTSPSAADAASVARAAECGAGVLLMTGNYAGDVMNFTLAADTLKVEGIDARYLVVTDDIASAPPTEMARRRGIAGGFAVFKSAAAAAAEGYALDDVERVARRANDRTRTLGVGFDGCTLPGAATPLFSVPGGLMGVGLGIHGEPGIAEEPLPAAAELAALLVASVTAERPAGTGGRVAAILNGLGRTKYEEMFVLWAHIARLLDEAGLQLVEPAVGELVTSLDMAGCSLTLTWLDDELERFWRAPADTPAYKKGSLVASEEERPRRHSTAASAAASSSAGSRSLTGPERACAANAVRAIRAIAAAMTGAEAALGALDAVAGDGDHGRGMVRGSQAALQAAEVAQARDADCGEILTAAGRTWAAQAGGTSGVLWGAGLEALGGRLSGRPVITPEDLCAAMRDAYAAIARLGHAELGDKTMLDALGPFNTVLESGISGRRPLAEAWGSAASSATRAAEQTAGLRPKVGRARPLAERSVGTPDPGATSLAICLEAVEEVLGPRTE